MDPLEKAQAVEADCVVDIAAHVCSDGGEGSVRVPLQVPDQTYWNYDHQEAGLWHMDYICPYGSQPGVCPPRDLTLFQATRDELEQPSGPMFSDCHNPDVPDFECCRAEHAFRIRGGFRRSRNKESARTSNSIRGGVPTRQDLHQMEEWWFKKTTLLFPEHVL